MEIILLADWEYDGKSYKSGTRLRVDDDTAAELIASKTAKEFVAKSAVTVVGSDDHADDAADGDAAPTKGLTAEDVQKIVSAAVAKAAKTPANRPRIEVGQEQSQNDPKRGFPSLGDFLMDVMQAGSPGGQTSKRLRALHTKAVGSDEYTTVQDALGGFLIPPQYRDDVFSKGVEGDMARMHNAVQLPVDSTMLAIPAETDTTHTSGALFGGVQVYRLKERGVLTASSGTFEQIELRPTPLAAIYHVTDNLLANSSSLAAIVSRQFGQAMVYKETAEFLNGTGSGGQCLGALSAANGALQSLTRTTTGTIVTDDIINMVSHCWDFGNAVWIMSRSCMPAVMTLSIAVGTGGAPLMLFNIGESGQQTLWGRPIIYTEHNQTLGTAGDIGLVSWPHYVIGEGRSIHNDSSIHVRYEYLETSFRISKTIDAKPYWRTTLTLTDSFVVSPFVRLAT